MNNLTNWKPGDKAVCVLAFTGRGLKSKQPMPPESCPDGLPVLGTTYLVSGVHQPEETVLLELAGLRSLSRRGNRGGWVEYKFRKVVTRTEQEALSALDGETNKQTTR